MHRGSCDSFVCFHVIDFDVEWQKKRPGCPASSNLFVLMSLVALVEALTVFATILVASARDIELAIQLMA